MSVPQINPAHDVTIDGATTPIEFTFKGTYRPDDQARAVWRVEAAPIGSLTTFELERDELSGQWIIRSV